MTQKCNSYRADAVSCPHIWDIYPHMMGRSWSIIIINHTIYDTDCPQGVTRGLESVDNQGLNKPSPQKIGVSVQHPLTKNMFPQFYQRVLETHLSPTQYLTLQLLILLLQSHRQVSLARLAQLFPQPIKYESRLRNLQRFLNLPNLSAKLLWFPIIKQVLK